MQGQDMLMQAFGNIGIIKTPALQEGYHPLRGFHFCKMKTF
jgi:hypothetical protein